MIGTAPIPTPPAVATPSFETPIARSPLIGMDSSREESLRNDIASRKQEVSMAQLQASTVAITADQAKQRVADLEAELARLAQEKAEVTGRVSQVRALYEADRMVVQQLESQAGPLREEVVGLRAELDRTALERDALRNQIDSMNRDIMQLRMERESLVLQTRDAGKMLRSDGEAVAELEREVHFLKDEVEKLQHEVAEAAKERERTAADHEMKLADRERLRAQAAHLRAENEKIMKEAADIAAQTAALTVLSDEAPAEAAVEEVSASEIQAAAGTIPSPKPILAEEALPATVAPSALTVDISALEDPFAEPPEPSPPIPDASTKPERGSSWKARTPEPPAKTPEPVVESIAVEEAEPTPAPVALTVDAMPALPVSPVDEIVEPAPRTPSPFDVDHFENRFPDVDTEFVIAEAPASSSDVAALASQPEEPGKSGVAEALPVSPVSAATPETRPSASVNVDHEGAISPTSAPVETAAEQSSAEQVSETLFEAKPQAPNESNPFELEAASTSAASAPATASVAVTKTPFDMPDLDAEFEDAFKDIPAAGTAGAAAAFDDSVFDATFDDDFKFESQANFGTPAPASGQSVPAMSAVVSPPPVPAPAPSQVPAPTFPPENSEVTPISGISGNFVSFENTFDAPFDDFGREAKPPVAAASEEDPFVALAKGGPIPELSKATAADIDSAFGPGGNVPAAGDSGNPFAGAPVAVTAPPDFDAAFEADFDSAFQGGAGAATFEAADGKAAPEAAAPAAVEKEPVAAAGDEAEEVRLVKEMTSCTTEVAMDALYKTDWNVERAINQILG